MAAAPQAARVGQVYWRVRTAWKVIVLCIDTMPSWFHVRPKSARLTWTSPSSHASPSGLETFASKDIGRVRPRTVRVPVTPAACRQLASGARRHIRASQTPATPTARQARIVRDFKRAWQAGDIDALIGLLDPSATAVADGGGLVSAVLRPVEGGEQIARFFADAARAVRGVTILERTVNGQPGLVAQQDGVTVAVLAFDVAGDRIKHIWVVRNPDKLRSWTTG